MSKRRRALVVAAVLVASGCGAAAVRTVPGRAAACDGEPRALVVDAGRRTMTVCEDGRAASVLGVRLGRAGAGKTREGDKRTPSGRYALRAPVASREFGTFIPIAYPTPAQVHAGYTGSAVGVHGPARRVRFLGRLVNVFDTTDGCVGLSSDEETEEVAAWVRAHPGATILVR